MSKYDYESPADKMLKKQPIRRIVKRTDIRRSKLLEVTEKTNDNITDDFLEFFDEIKNKALKYKGELKNDLNVMMNSFSNKKRIILR